MTYDITKSAFLTSLTFGLGALPILLAGLPGGLLVDAWDRRKLLAVTYLYQALITIGFSTLVILDRAQTWHIFSFVFLSGIAAVITEPARASIIPNIVPRKNLVNAFALIHLASAGPRLAVPALGGLLLASVGPGPTLLVDSVGRMAAMFMTFGLRLDPSSLPQMRLGSTTSKLLGGLRYVKGTPVILGLILLGVLPAMLVLPFVHGLLPVYAAEVFEVGPFRLGLMLSALGLGSIAGNSVLASVGEVRRKGLLVLTSILLTGVAMVILSRNPVYGLVIPTIMLVSGGLTIFSATSSATIQSIIPNDLRGRVAALYFTVWGLVPVGSLAAGIIAGRLGAPAATLIAAATLVAVLTVLAVGFPALRRLQ